MKLVLGEEQNILKTPPKKVDDKVQKQQKKSGFGMGNFIDDETKDAFSLDNFMGSDKHDESTSPKNNDYESLKKAYDEKVQNNKVSANNDPDSTLNTENFSTNSEEEELRRLAMGSARIILEIKSVFPFAKFPTTLILDEQKISIRSKYFLSSGEVKSILYKEIMSVTIQEGVRFATLEFVEERFAKEKIKVEYLHKEDARRARRLIQGFVIARKKHIDTSQVPTDELVELIERIGKTR